MCHSRSHTSNISHLHPLLFKKKSKDSFSFLEIRETYGSECESQVLNANEGESIHPRGKRPLLRDQNRSCLGNYGFLPSHFSTMINSDLLYHLVFVSGCDSAEIKHHVQRFTMTDTQTRSPPPTPSYTLTRFPLDLIWS